MFNLQEIFKTMNEIADESYKPEIIKVLVNVIPDYESRYGTYWKDIIEDLPTGSNSIYDDQTLEEWYDFVGTVEGFVDNYCDTINISMSKNPNSLSEYIDFYVYDKDGNKKNYLIDLRLSDHSSTQNARMVRKKNANKIDVNYKLLGVTVNDKTFNSYSDAEKYIRKIIFKETF